MAPSLFDAVLRIHAQCSGKANKGGRPVQIWFRRKLKVVDQYCGHRNVHTMTAVAINNSTDSTR